jgi:eukaryotic-like serine/threonine-protein kinase
VPAVVGRTRAAAERALAEAGLAVSVTEKSDERVDKGLVITTDPAAGKEAAPGAMVTVVVSTGRRG